MLTAQFAPACAITELGFPSKRASDSSNNFSLRRPRDWGWASRSCVQSLNHTAAQSRPKMRMAAARSFTLLFQRTPKLYDPSKQPCLRDRRRSVGAEGPYSTASLSRVQERNFCICIRFSQTRTTPRTYMRDCRCADAGFKRHGSAGNFDSAPPGGTAHFYYRPWRHLDVRSGDEGGRRRFSSKALSR